jgi:CRP-like cAMP-binding protein
VDVAAILKKSDLFSDIGDSSLRKIADIAHVRQYPKAGLVFREGDEGKEFYVVKSGSVAINKNIAGGRKRNLDNLKAGEVFGEIALFDSQARSADAESLEDAEVIALPNAKFLELLSADPELAISIQKKIILLLCRRLRNTDDMLKEGVIWGFKIED